MYRATPEGFASIITVFSAPNYCDAYGNKGSILHYDGEKVGIRWYHHSPHPFVLANMMDAFSWSLPFVAEKSLPCPLESMNQATDILFSHRYAANDP